MLLASAAAPGEKIVRKLPVTILAVVAVVVVQRLHLVPVPLLVIRVKLIVVAAIVPVAAVAATTVGTTAQATLAKVLTLVPALVPVIRARGILRAAQVVVRNTAIVVPMAALSAALGAGPGTPSAEVTSLIPALIAASVAPLVVTAISVPAATGVPAHPRLAAPPSQDLQRV